MNLPLRLLTFAFTCGLFFLSSLDAQTAPTTRPTTQSFAEGADIADPKVDRSGQIDGRFEHMHELFLHRGKQGKIGVLFLGDSITEGWSGGGRLVWAKSYWKYDPANFGIGGDKTQNVLWRIENGELDHINPKVVVLMIGTNNMGGYSVQDIIVADAKIVREIHQKLPDTKLLLLAIFPRGADPKDSNVAAMRQKIQTVNEGLAKLDDGDKTRYLDIGPKFLDVDGKISKDIMPDALHPNARGYQIWADAMQPLLDQMMKGPTTEPGGGGAVP